MDTDIEKRISTRKSIRGSITLHTTIGWSEDINALLLNYSEQGICFSTREQLAPGTTVIFRTKIDKYLDVGNDEDYRMPSIGMVKVKWCHETSMKEKAAYLVGELPTWQPIDRINYHQVITYFPDHLVSFFLQQIKHIKIIHYLGSTLLH